MRGEEGGRSTVDIVVVMTGEVICESAEQKGEERGTAIAVERTQFEVWMRLMGEGEK